MVPKRPINIVVINDQVFPIKETDAEQIVCSMSAMGKLDGVEIQLLLPVKWGAALVTAEDLASYYEVEKTFQTATQKSTFPSFRGIEKVSHGLACISNPVFRNADVVYTRNIPTAVAALVLSDKPVVYETFRPWPLQQRAMVPLLRRMVTHRRFLGAVTHSALAGLSFVDIGMPRERLLVAYNGFEPKRMQPVIGKAAARAALGLSRKRHVISYVGHVSMEKGLGTMLALAERMRDARFVIVGSTAPGEVERRAAGLPNVRVVPWQPFRATVPYLYASDVLLIPPTREPLQKVGNTVLPIKTFLYMASGRAIFGPSTPDLMELLEHGRNAVLVPPDDLDAAHAALTQLLEDAPLRKKLGAEAAANVAALTWDRRAERVLEFIEARLVEIAEE